MAVDTKARRFQMLSFSDGALLPDPDGTIVAEDRAHLLWLYGGIVLAGVITGTVNLTLPFRSITLTLKERSNTLTLPKRSNVLTLPERDN